MRDHQRPHRRRATRRSTLTKALAFIAALIVVTVILRSVSHSAGASSVSSASTVAPTTSSTTTLPPTSVNISHWPLHLPAAYGVPSRNSAGTNYTGRAMPIASLAKIMTAVVVEQHLPLGATGDGPIWTVTPQDVATASNQNGEDGITIGVTAGEQITERSLLEGMLVHSANNFAVMLTELARIPMDAFIAEMNSEATTLGMDHTHYADTNGLSAGDVSTPTDQVLAAEKLETYPLLAQLVSETSMSVNGQGPFQSFTPLVGTHGVVGIKSGATNAAGGCDVLMIDPVVNGQPTPIIVAVLHATGWPDLGIAGNTAISIAHQVAGQEQINVSSNQELSVPYGATKPSQVSM